jgi:predicted solute-binding protein
MSLSKSAERAAMEQIASILLPMSMHTDTYGVGAMLDLCHAWARAMDTDMPLECFTRDREAIRAERDATVKACNLAIERAESDAARIVKAAEDRAQRISRICQDQARQAVKALEGV